MENKNQQMEFNFEPIESSSLTKLPSVSYDKNEKNTNVDFSLTERLAAQKKKSISQIYKNVSTLVDHLY